MKVLSIDPGFDRMGVAVLTGNASTPTILHSECITPPKGAPEERLAFLHQSLTELISTHTPDTLAVETLFFSVNKKTALRVAEVRGVVLALGKKAGLTVLEIPPGSIKLAVTGNGRADKKAIMRMIPLLVTLPIKKRLDDEFDAIAVGIAALSLHNPQR